MMPARDVGQCLDDLWSDLDGQVGICGWIAENCSEVLAASIVDELGDLLVQPMCEALSARMMHQETGARMNAVGESIDTIDAGDTGTGQDVFNFAWTQPCQGMVAVNGYCEVNLGTVVVAAEAGSLTGGTAANIYGGFMQIYASLDGATPVNIGGGLSWSFRNVDQWNGTTPSFSAEIHNTFDYHINAVSAGPHTLDISAVQVIQTRDAGDALIGGSISGTSRCRIITPNSLSCCP